MHAASDLGLTRELLAELASVDWHAGHPDVPHPTPYTEHQLGARDVELVEVSHPCACDTWRVLSEFAVRLLTGQAPASTTRDGAYVGLLYREVDPDARPLSVKVATARPEDLDPPLATVVVHGYPQVHEGEHTGECHSAGCAGAIEFTVTGASVAGMDPMSAAEAVPMVIGGLRIIAEAVDARERGEA